MVSSSLIIIDQHWSQLIIVLMLIIIDQPLSSSISIDKNRSSLTFIDKYHCLWLITIEQILMTTDHHWSPLIIVILVAFRIASLIPCDSALFVHGSGCSCSKSREIRDWAWGQKQSARSRKARGASGVFGEEIIAIFRVWSSFHCFFTVLFLSAARRSKSW